MLERTILNISFSRGSEFSVWDLLRRDVV